MARRLALFALTAVLAALTLAVPTRAEAQDEMGADFGSFELNSILVAGFEADQPFLVAEAQRVHGLVVEALSASYLIVKMSEVPPFTDYDAEVYLRSCPVGQYIGCVFVVGGRAQTDWTIGGRVKAVEGGYQVFLSFIDVAKAKLVLEFDVVLDGSNDAEFQEGVVKVVDALMRGDVNALDLRGDPEADRRAAEEARTAESAAKGFVADSIYEDPYAVDRGTVGTDAGLGGDEVRGGQSAGRVTRSELDALEDRGGLTPWERAGLTKGQYKLYRNSGTKLRDFKKRLMGRKGQIILRLSMQVGSGPYGQRHETFWVQDNAVDPAAVTPDDIIDQATVQAQATGLNFGGQFEFDIGLTPWLELGMFGGIRSAPFNYRLYGEVQGVTRPVPDLENGSGVTWQAGVRIGAIPFPAFPVRPTIHVGASFWQGGRVTRLTEVPGYLLAAQVRPNNMVLIHAQPGAEVSVGKVVVIWTRFDLDVAVIGRTIQTINRGDRSLSVRPDTNVAGPIGIGASLGLAFRLNVGPKRR